VKKPNSFSNSFQKISYVIPFYDLFIYGWFLISFWDLRIVLSLKFCISLIKILFMNSHNIFMITMNKLNNIKISHYSFIIYNNFKVHHSKTIVFLVKTVINIFKFIYFTFQVMLSFFFFIMMIILQNRDFAFTNHAIIFW
jgi:hypothetical protein